MSGETPEDKTEPTALNIVKLAKHEETAKQLEKSQLPVQVFQTLEKRDEDQILAEMRGEPFEELVYKAAIQGREGYRGEKGGRKDHKRLGFQTNKHQGEGHLSEQRHGQGRRGSMAAASPA